MNPTSKSVLTALNMIYFSLVTVMTMFSAVVLYLSTYGSITPDPELALILRYVLIVLLPLGAGAGYFVFKQWMQAINPSISLREKLMKYQTAVLIRSGCFEMPGLFGAVATMVTGDNSFLLFTAIVIVLFLLLRPTIYTICTDLNLSQKDRAILENPSSPL
jgi:hypothetical protein